MQVEKLDKKEITEAEIDYYSNYKGIPMVKIKGNFKGGGFFLSKSKVAVVLNNVEQLQKFAAGDFDEKIKALGEDEVLRP